MSDIILYAIFGGVGAAILWGIADFWAAKASRTIGPVSAVIAVNTIGALGFTLFYLISGQVSAFTTPGVWYALAGGGALGIGFIAFYQALKIGPVSLITPLTSAYPLATTAWLVLLFNISLSHRELIGIGIVMIGILAASGLFTFVINQKLQRFGRGPFLALFTALLWGSGYALLSEALETISWQAVSLLQLITIASICALLAPAIKGDEKLLDRKNLAAFTSKFVIGAGIIQMIGLVLINVAFERSPGNAPLITALSACYPILTIFLALFYLREKPDRIPLMGAVATVFGVVILSLG